MFGRCLSPPAPLSVPRFLVIPRVGPRMSWCKVLWSESLPKKPSVTPKASRDPHFNRLQCSGRDFTSAVVKWHPLVVATHGVSWIVLGDFQWDEKLKDPTPTPWTLWASAACLFYRTQQWEGVVGASLLSRCLGRKLQCCTRVCLLGEWVIWAASPRPPQYELVPSSNKSCRLEILIWSSGAVSMAYLKKRCF